MSDEQLSMQTIDAITETRPVPVGASDAFTSALEHAVSSSEYTGDVPLVDKQKLVGVPFIIVSFAENESDMTDGYYAFVRCLLPNGKQVGFNDGGVAIGPVLKAHALATGFDDAGRESIFTHPLLCSRGLVRSEYDNKDGIHAVTYRLS